MFKIMARIVREDIGEWKNELKKGRGECSEI